MRWCKISNGVLLATALACLWISACHGGSKANQVLVSVSPSSGTLAITQFVTFTAIVTGATDVSATFDCSYTTTPNPTSATPNPTASTPAECSSANGAVGTLSNIQNTSTTSPSTATFTAPSTFPDSTKFANVQIIITATAKADTKKSGKATITLDSGVRLQIVPATSTIATSASELFLAETPAGTVISNSSLKWDVTTDATATATSKTCTPTCGTITASSGTTGATYTAPSSVPSQATATVFATSTIDPSRRAQATITIVKAGDITFSGISPSVVPQGGLQQDIFLAATNANSQTGVTLSLLDSSGNVTSVTTLAPSQIKVVFTAGSTSSSIGARARLNSAQLATAGHYQVQVSSSNTSVKVTGGPFPLDIVPVRPAIASSTPDNFQESTLGQTGGVPFVIDGGFFGPPSAPTVSVAVNGQALLANTSNSLVPSARRIGGSLPSPLGTANAGLFPVSVKYSTTATGPFPAPVAMTAYTNIAVIPDYGNSNKPSTPSLVTLPASSTPSAIALDPVLGYAVVTLAGLNTSGSNNVQFINLAGGTPALAAAVPSGGNVATGVAVDDQLHVAAVVNYASRSLSILSVPSGTPLGTVDLSGVISPPAPASSTFVEPFPYSVGVDPFSHRAVVAFASTNVGLIINLDPSVTPSCLPIAAQSTYCPIAYVTLNSGANPQVAFEPGARLAYVTPGGAGLLSAVSLANPSGGSVGIVSATRNNSVVTVTTSSSHNLNPGNPGTVLISGLPAGTKSNTNFNGSFAASVLDATHFQYFQADKDDTTTCTATCLASSGTPFLTYTISPSTVGIAINPITRQAILADPNATVSQISYIDPQSESVTSTTLFFGATGAVSSGSPELGATTVAFQPFSNTALSFNPKTNQVSLLDPSLLQRPAFVATSQNGQGTVSFTSGSTSAITVTVPGALAVDSVNNLTLAVNSGSSSISVFKLGSIKPVHIERVITPAIDAGNANITMPANITPAVKITLGATPAAVGPVKIFGSGFATTPLQVRLDGADVTTMGATVTANGSNELDVTFPATIPGTNPPVPFFSGPRHYALDVITSAPTGSNTSNVVDFTVLEEVPLPACSGNAAAPGGVAIDEVNNLAVVTNTGSGCNQVSVLSLNPANIFNQTVKTIPTGATPTVVAVLPRLTYTGQTSGSGVAVVTNNSANTVSILDLVNLKQVVSDVAVGTSPSGVAIDQETNLAVIANTGSNTVSTIDLTPLTASPIGKLAPTTVFVDQQPIAVAIDPDRGSNGRGLAVVTSNGASTSSGVLDAIDIGGSTPSKLTSASVSGIQSTPTGIVFDPAVSPALFYVTSSQANQITTFNPDSGGLTQSIKVGINPNAIAYNFQTGTILTVNALSNSISIVDSQTFRTKATLGIGAASKFAAAIQTSTNLAVIADQANNRVLLFPLPK